MLINVCAVRLCVSVCECECQQVCIYVFWCVHAFLGIDVCVLVCARVSVSVVVSTSVLV